MSDVAYADEARVWSDFRIYGEMLRSSGGRVLPPSHRHNDGLNFRPPIHNPSVRSGGGA